MKDKRVFVSGGNGVIGNPLVEKLAAEGAVLFVGDLKPRPPRWPGNARYRQGDLNHLSREEIEDFRPEYFFHLAATFERSIETYEFWAENYWHNIRLSNHLMSLMKDMESLRKVIFASSYLIYDPRLYTFAEPASRAYGLKETDPINPRNLTGAAKLYHELELGFLEQFKGARFKTVSARIFRSYGRGSRDIISRWIRALLDNEELTVFNKEGLFDYIYAEEVAEGLLTMALHEDSGGIFNLGSGNARRVGEVLSILGKHFPGLTCREEDRGLPYEGSQADMERFAGVFGWRPAMQLEDAIPRIIEFEKSRPPAGAADFNVLVTSISKKTGLLKALKQACLKLNPSVKLIGGDVDNAVIGRYFVDEFWNMPPAARLTFEKVCEFCAARSIRLIIPTRDGELEFWSSLKDSLSSKNIHVMVSAKEAVSNCLDKLKFYRLLKNSGLPAIPASADIGKLPGTRRFVVKERYGAGSIGVGVNLERRRAIAYARKLKHPIFQPFIDGTEISVDSYVDEKYRLKGIILRKRDLVVNGESQITTTFRDERLEGICLETIRALRIKGHSVLQILIDAQGGCHIMECNSRFGGASALSVRCGLDSFYWALLEAAGEDLEDYPFIGPSAGLRQIRFAEDFYEAV